MSHSGIRTPRAGSSRLHQHRDDRGAQQLSSIKNVLVLTDHFTRYAMAFVTKDQKAKTVVQILYEWFISIFGVPAKLLSD